VVADSASSFNDTKINKKAFLSFDQQSDWPTKFVFASHPFQAFRIGQQRTIKGVSDWAAGESVSLGGKEVEVRH
jgi:hypothetical protein